MRRQGSRTVIGGSNRRSASAGSLGVGQRTPPIRPRTPLPAPAAAAAPVPADMSSQSELSQQSLTTGPQLRAQQRPRPRSGEIVPSALARVEDTFPSSSSVASLLRERPSTGQAGARPAHGEGTASSSVHGAKALSGHQESVMNAMTDFFGRRPLVQMRNAFRDADKDRSGELDYEEFKHAMKTLNVGLSEPDLKVVFQLGDNDGGGTIGIDEFFNNFRHDHWPRERFFWAKSASGAADLSKRERFELAAKLRADFEEPAKLTTPEIMKVLSEKVANHGSAEKVFRIIDTNLNGEIDLDEIPEAIRPYELVVDERQAADVLAEINRIAGKPPDAPLVYASFAQAFNPTGPPGRMGSIAFQDVPCAGGSLPRSELVRKRAPPDTASGLEYRALGPERSLESLHPTSSASSRLLETVDVMRSVSTLHPAAPPLDHSASTATLRGINRELSERRFDMMSGWRGDGDDAIDGGGDKLGKEMMHVGRDIDWTTNNQYKSMRQTMLQANPGASSASALTPLEDGARSMHRQQQQQQAGTAWGAAAPSALDASAGAGEAPAMAPATAMPPPAGGVGASTSYLASLSTLQPSITNSSLSRSRSRLELALELSGSRSSKECLYPGAASHHHVHESERLYETSSLASLHSVVGGGRVNARQVGDRDRKQSKLRVVGARQAQRQQKLHSLLAQEERMAEQLEDSRRRIQAKYVKRIGEQQLLQLTRGMENGKAPIALEKGPKPSWVPVPPHLSSSWATISHQLDDPPYRESAAHLKATGGRRSFPERGLSAADGTLRQPVVWGGAHP